MIAGPPQRIAVTPDQRYAYVTGGNSVSVVDLRTSLSATGDTVVLSGDSTTWLNAATGTSSGSVPSVAPGVTSNGVITPEGATPC